MKMLKVLILASVIGIVAACKLAVIVVEGGEVQSIGSGTCVEGTICVHQVSDTNYTETFTAVPNSGWAFVKWNSGGGFFCQGSTDPICVISGEGAEENQAIEAIIESDKAFYIMPVFIPFQPITDTVTVDGKEWAQVDLFTHLSWNDINAVCPAGVCINNGILNGYDMTGWTWASVDDVNALFNYYIGSDALGPGPDVYADDFDSEWAPAFFSNGWRSMTTGDSGDSVVGWVRTLANESDAHSPSLVDDLDGPGVMGDIISTGNNTNIDERRGGAWFYRTP